MVNDADLQVYGEHSCDAAGVVGGYLDSLIQSIAPTAPAAKTGGAHSSSSAASDYIAEDGESNQDGAAQKDNSKSRGKKNAAGGADAGEEEKVDNFNNFVRKNLKSGGTSKYLNRATTRVSMSKQRWLTRAGENGGGGGGGGGFGKGKYGSKFGKGKYGSNKGGGSGGYKYTSDDAGGAGGGDGGGSGVGGGGYNKPRGLQQWGLDALEMSLDLIEQQVAASESAQDVAATVVQVGDVPDSKSVLSAIDLPEQTAEAAKRAEDAAKVNATAASIHAKPSNEHARPPEDPVVQAQTTAGVGSATHSSHNSSAKSNGQSSDKKKSAPRIRTISLDAIDKTLRPSSSKRPSAQDKLTAKVSARTKLNERLNAMTACAPKCPGHSMPSKLLVVKKSGANKVKCIIYYLINLVLLGLLLIYVCLI